MSNRSSGEQSKTVVDACYQAGVEGRLREVCPVSASRFRHDRAKIAKSVPQFDLAPLLEGQDSDQAQSALRTPEKFRPHAVRL